MNYKPEPIDTSKVTLTPEQLNLTELLAKNTHDNWAQQRISEGWKYGTQRDDSRKEHPGLVPYDELSESEKQYDRIIALEILKALLGLGYRIEGSQTISLSLESASSPNLTRALQNLNNQSEINLAELLTLHRQTIEIKPHTPDIYQTLGNYILQAGEPLIAYDVLAEGFSKWPDDVRLQQLLALALARSGATHRANSLLLQLLASGHSDEETLGLLARTHKDLWGQAKDPSEKLRQLRLAGERYSQAYKLSGSYWTGINAATMAMLMGEENCAKEIALEVHQQCIDSLKQLSGKGGDKYWLLATLGEAALILRQWSEAEDWYDRAAQVGKGRFGDLSSTRRNATLLVRHLEGDIERIKKLFDIPRVVVFTGHMLDQPDRTVLRFPPGIEAKVYESIRSRLEKLDARLGYASAACGSDILFQEAILDLGGEAHIVLPYNKQQFIKDSVNIIPGDDWRNRFEGVLEKATEVIIASTFKLEETNVLYEYTNRMVHGLAKIRAELLETELVPLAVWNGKLGDGVGGTASAIEHWQSCGYDVEIIDIKSILQQELNTFSPIYNAEPAGVQASSSAAESEVSKSIMALLFADVVHYSKLREDEIVPFVQHFLGGIADLVAKSAYAPIMRNTWGDAVYFVFKDVLSAGQLALDLCDFVHNTDWSAKGLPANLSLRIGLHAGPVYRHVDPVTNQTNYIGTHVSQAARIEPITPPGKVYASQAFAALARAENIREFTCDYVGQTPLAKSYGTFPTYHVRRR